MSFCIDDPSRRSGNYKAHGVARLWPGDVWDRWYDVSTLPDALKSKLSVHDMKVLAYHGSDAFKPPYDALVSSLQRLTIAARTSGGAAGPDAELIASCEAAEKALAGVM